jgi:signal transduction histidine kinase
MLDAVLPGVDRFAQEGDVLAAAATVLERSGGVRLRLVERVEEGPSPARVREAEALLAKAARSAHGPAVDAVVEDARDLVDALSSAAGEGPEARRLAFVMFAAGVIAGLAVEDELAADELGRLMPRLAGVAELSPQATTFAIFERAIRDPRLVELPPRIAIETNLRLLSSFAPIGTASLWRTGPGESPRCLFHTGCSAPTRRMRLAAREAAGAESPARTRRSPAIRAVPIERLGEIRAVLVVRAGAGEGERAVAFARESVRALELVLGRAELLEHDLSRERSLLESTERRLVRLGFDLHDGPLQDVGAAMLQLRLLRTDLGRALPRGSERETVLDRLGELERSLVDSESELRDLARSAGSSALRRSLRSSIESEAAAFASAAELDVRVDLRGDLESITASQKIALIRVVQEALTNAGRHGGATEARIEISHHPDGVRAEIRDNGCGFDVERTLVDAARRGRIGLLGMSERIRLLGGTFDVTSCPGDATVVSLTLPNWRPIWTDVEEASA